MSIHQRIQRIINAGCVPLLTVGTLFGVRPAIADGPATVELTGVVRDFREQSASGGHPDFERRPDHGFGHYAGNIALRLGEDGKPVYVGTGYKVLAQAYDSAGRPIAPHLANRRFVDAGTPLAPAFDRAIVKDSSGLDAYEVELRSAEFNDDGTSTWRYRVRETGGGMDLSHWLLRLDPSQGVVAGTTPGYHYGVDGSTGYLGVKWDVNGAFEDGEFTIVLDGHYAGADLEDSVVCKSGTDARFGDLFAPTAAISSTGSPYAISDDRFEDVDMDDTEASTGFDDGGGISQFHTWFNDLPGVNISAPLILTLVRQDDGSYVFDDTEDERYSERGGFFPIDNALLGNSGGSPDHNFHFTFELHTTFTYAASSEQVFTFTGDDDVWVFIDDKLVIDLGGVHSPMDQHIDLDRLGLVDGESYSLDFFFAERHRTQSNFRIQTNLELESNPLPPIMMAFD